MSDTNEIPLLRMHLWLEKSHIVFFSQGRMQLLEAIEQTGSLQGAAKCMGMSYRAAWGKLRATEEIWNCKLLEHPNGRHAGGCLSQEAVAMMQKYRSWQTEVEEFALKSAQKHLGYTPQKFIRKKQLISKSTTEIESKAK